MNILQRLLAPTPVFFQKLRNWGIALTAFSAFVLGLPFAIPEVITAAAGYLAVAGTVLSGVSQATVDQE